MPTLEHASVKSCFVIGAKANGAKVNDPAQFSGQRGNQILCCAFNANGTIFVTGSSDTLARVCH